MTKASEPTQAEILLTQTNILAMLTCITDNHGVTADRYCFWFRDGSWGTLEPEPVRGSAFVRFGNDHFHKNHPSNQNLEIIQYWQLPLPVWSFLVEKIRATYEPYLNEESMWNLTTEDVLREIFREFPGAPYEIPTNRTVDD